MTTEPIFAKFLVKMAHGPRKNRLDIGGSCYVRVRKKGRVSITVGWDELYPTRRPKMRSLADLKLNAFHNFGLGAGLRSPSDSTAVVLMLKCYLCEVISADKRALINSRR